MRRSRLWRLFFFAVIFTVNIFYLRASTVTGIVTDENKLPLKNANLKIEGIPIGTATNDTGYFKINDIPAGKYTLNVSFIGFMSESINFEITGDVPVYLEIILKRKNVELNNVVITGTRTTKNLSDSPVRTELISASDISRSGFTRLDEVLFEQPGLAIIDDHGKGIQMQGLDPAYTLVLIDGEPLIGRTAGTLELSRFSVSNLKQVEIVKGPSSSLYGSDALAGVINLITEMQDLPREFKLQSIYKTNNTFDILGNVSINNDAFSASLFFDRLSSDGYDLTPSSLSLTSPGFSDYTIAPKLSYRFSDSSVIKLSGRVFLEKQINTLQLLIEGKDNLINETGKLTDWNSSLTLEHKFTGNIKSEVKLYLSGYFTDSRLVYNENGSIYDNSLFDQHAYKGEVKNDFILNDQNYIVAGGGYLKESVEANRIYSGKKTAGSYYMFVQEEWIPNDLFDFVVGTRYDWHSEYASRLSPKLSAVIKPFNFLKVRASFGGGFKAPTLQQLYLDFTNPQVGYSVFGSSNIKESFRQMQEQGQISRVFIDPSGIETIRAENSLAFNLGFEITPWKFLSVFINLFRNNVKDLIEAVPVAAKTNGQSVFTYFNLNKIYTQGIENEIKITPLLGLSFSFSYQYLEAIDEDVLQQIRNKEISKVGANGRVRFVEESEYGGLYNRSKHSGTVKLEYQNEELGFTANIRGIIRDKYGYGDVNGNGILDDKSEYVPGYSIWNFTTTKKITDYFSALFGIENILDKTNSQFIPSLPGRIIYGGIQLSFF